MTVREERDARLDSLREDFDAFVEQERKRLERQILLIEGMLEGRGVEALKTNILNKLSEKAENSLELFLTG